MIVNVGTVSLQKWGFWEWQCLCLPGVRMWSGQRTLWARQHVCPLTPELVPAATRQHNYQSSPASASCDLGLVDWNTNMKLHSAPRPQAGLKVYNQYGTNYDAVAVLCPCWPQLERAEQNFSPEPRRHYLHAAVAAEPSAASEGWARLRHGRGSRHTRP